MCSQSTGGNISSPLKREDEGDDDVGNDRDEGKEGLKAPPLPPSISDDKHSDLMPKQGLTSTRST